MRDYGIQFAQRQEAPSKEPRWVVRIMFDVASLSCTSHADIPNVPGVVLERVLKEPSAISQRLILSEGRSEIGTFDFTLVDADGAFTDEIRAKLDDSEGLRGRQVLFYIGHAGDDFTAFKLFQTQLVEDAEEESGVYRIQCRDITREKHKDIFEPKSTTLRNPLTDTATTVDVYDTSAFITVVHGTSWSDAPSSTVGYILIEKEVIRYTGKAADQFTGCTRGVLNTKAVAHVFDSATAADRRPKVEEYIYLELPAVKLAWAILTNEIYGTANTIPAHWGLGIDTSLIRESDFTSIGTDLWNPSDDTAAVVLRFEGLKKTDGKRFLEREIYTLLNCFPPVYSDGTLGLRRLPAMVRDAAPVATLTDNELISVSALRHRMSTMYNVFRIDWNWDTSRGEFTRNELIIDSNSISANGTAPVKRLEFRGLFGSRHTGAIVRSLTDALRDAYSWPPEEVEIDLPGSLIKLENGDVVRLRTSLLKDYAGPGPTIDRSFLITNLAYDARNDRVSASLFGSTFRPSAEPPTAGAVTPLPDAYYNSSGAALSTVLTIVSNVVQPGSYTINGHADLGNTAAIFYHLADLTIADGAVITITGNVQLRIRGFLTVNGDIVGTGGGKAGVSDPGTGSWDATFAGNPGYVGHSRGWDGIKCDSVFKGVSTVTTLPAVLTRGQFDAVPFLALKVSGNALLGLPSDLRGTGGAPGGRLVTQDDAIAAVGGPGAAGGAGLAIICRGMSFGVSGSITLNGADPSATATANFAGPSDGYPGFGGAGGPGAMLILLDGNSISVPDVTARVFSLTGTVNQLGNVLPTRTRVVGPNPSSDGVSWSGDPYAGYADPSVISAQDWSNAAHRIQYIPESQTVNVDADPRPAAPTALQIATGVTFVAVRATVTLAPEDVLEIHASLDNNRANAVRVAWGHGTEFTHELPPLTTRYYWARVRRDFTGRPDVFSDWYPSGSTSGQSATTVNPGGWILIPDAEGKPKGIRGIEGIADRSHLQFGGIGFQILSTTDDSVGYGFPAIPIDDTQSYELTIRHKSSASDSDGLYLRFNELNTALPLGKTHVGVSASGEPVTAERSSIVDVVSNGPQPGTTTVENTYTYTPTSGVKWASFSMYNWTGFSGTYEVEWVRLTRTGSHVNLLTNAGQNATDDIMPGAATDIVQFHDGSVVDTSTTGIDIFDHDFTPQYDCACFATAIFTGRTHAAPSGPDRVAVEIGQTGLGSNIQVSNPLTATDTRYVVTLSRDLDAGVAAQVLLTTFSYVDEAYTLTDVDLRIEVVKR